MKIAVTGANGYIARNLIEYLVNQKVAVVGFVRTGAANSPAVDSTFLQLHESDTGLPSRSALEGCTALIHLAGRAHPFTERETDKNLLHFSNHQVALHAAAAAAAARIMRFVQVSTVSVHGNWSQEPVRADSPIRPLTSYAATKWAAEEALTDYCAERRTQLCIVRPPLVYGPACPGNFTRLVRLIQSGIPLPFKSVTAARSFISVHNLVDFLYQCASGESDYERRVHVIGDGSDWIIPDLIREIAAGLNLPSRVLSCSPPMLRAAARLIGFGREMDSMTRSLVVDWSSSKALENGWTPPTSPADAFANALQEYR